MNRHAHPWQDSKAKHAWGRQSAANRLCCGFHPSSPTMNPAGSILATTTQRETALLASYALHSADSRGRKHAEPEHPYRGPFQRDRDRIVHSSAFRRLSGKMQVFTGDMGDYHRTRLTHTHEVASIARTIGRALSLNEDLIEALALVHDIGHPPFGHAGEEALDECLRDCGGFSHNRFALTLVEELESRYPAFPGLNLTQEVLEGQLARTDKQRGAAAPLAPLLETQVVEAADSMTYDAHDADDAVKLGLVSLEELAENDLVREALAGVRRQAAGLNDDLLRKAVVHQLIDRQVNDLLARASRDLASLGKIRAAEARQSAARIGPSSELAEQKRELERFLYERVYRHPQLAAVRHVAQSRLRGMFEFLVKNPDRLPARFGERAKIVGIPRGVGDYLAGMTDRYCDQQHRALGLSSE
ncbi:MAG: dNTP triphosphohydrolase [Pirellulaceae bacterium]|nr:dNTP triphosphohydrolase [Pirellulaceae bacterium]